MEQALYHPEYGYYASGKARIGKEGDFFTNVSVGPLFGRLLSMQFLQIWERLGKPDRFCLVEQGGNDGQLARDVLRSVSDNAPGFMEALRYVLVEPLTKLRAMQEEKLADFADKVSWQPALGEPFSGVHFSNELIDAMPAHLLTLREGGWKERRVVTRGTGFEFVELPISSPALRAYAEEAGRGMREGSMLEANLDSSSFLEALSSSLVSGYVLVLDYGDCRKPPGLQQPALGTLACYASHQRFDDPLQQPGERDITTRVDFTGLARAARTAGFIVDGFTDQHHFIAGLAAEGWSPGKDARENLHASLALSQLMHPNLMGTHFKVLSLRKGVEAGSNPLAGFRFRSSEFSVE